MENHGDKQAVVFLLCVYSELERLRLDGPSNIL